MYVVLKKGDGSPESDRSGGYGKSICSLLMVSALPVPKQMVWSSMFIAQKRPESLAMASGSIGLLLAAP